MYERALSFPTKGPITARMRPLVMSLFLLTLPGLSAALETDRQQPMLVDTGNWSGTLGDGVTTFKGGVDIRQGTLHIVADEADITKAEGRVSLVTFRGSPVRLEQEIEEQGMVNASAGQITYRVLQGVVELEDAVDVVHPQYRLTGAWLSYDLDTQQFEGNGSDLPDGRFSIRLDPEVAGDLPAADAAEDSGAAPEQDDAADQ